MLSLPDAIGQVLEKYMAEKDGVQEKLLLSVSMGPGDDTQTQASSNRTQDSNFLGSCPDCGAGQLSYQEGCVKCYICGYSECG